MNTNTERPIDRLFAHYSDDHQHPVNQRIHMVCVPAILWSVIALLWCIPSLAIWFRPGIWSAVSMFIAWMYYYRLSRPIGFGMLAVFFTFACLCRLIAFTYGMQTLLWLAVGVFVVAWIGQFIGHSKLFEGRKPSFFTDVVYLLVGPIWVLAKFYRKMGWKY
jgi:uncharacterized membrane protein YGL010W